ncbi:MAG: c-type cytochrome domain-containing protein, partial [Bythopirellula sp.]
MRLMILINVVSCCIFCACRARGEAQVEFNRDVRPILSENCFFCHGFDEGKRQADLRLDTREGATRDRGDYAAIVPGHADQSQLIERIFSHDPDIRMPPAESARALTDAQRDILRRWIAQGAEYQQHWAYRKLERPGVPDD